MPSSKPLDERVKNVDHCGLIGRRPASASCQLVCVQTAGSGMLNVLAADGTDCLTTSGDRGVCAGGNCMVSAICMCRRVCEGEAGNGL